MQNFKSMSLAPELMGAINKLGFTEPTEIQAKTIPLALAGKDIFGTSQTGTGKTIAFAIPLISRLLANKEETALVLTPTRELAMQIKEMMQKLARLKMVLLIGGASMLPQLKQLKEKPRIIIGTPGRINDHLSRKTLNLSKAKILVLDEADRMVDMGFGVQIDQILKCLPQDRQTLMFSATAAGNMKKMSQKYMNNPERIAIGSATTPISRIKQSNIMTDTANKCERMLEEIEKIDGSIIMFIKTKHGADKMVKRLVKEKFTASAIHGDLKQRKRETVLEGFRKLKYQILVATDIAARGLDIPHIEHVINYDLPMCPEDYIHRIGRTARAGAFGNALNFITKEDGKKWQAIQRMIVKG